MYHRAPVEILHEWLWSPPIGLLLLLFPMNECSHRDTRSNLLLKRKHFGDFCVGYLGVFAILFHPLIELWPTR